VIWHGDLYRLVSPYDENRAVLMYVNSSKNKAVLFAYTLMQVRRKFNQVRLQGLDPLKLIKYRKLISLLMDAGLVRPKMERAIRVTIF